MCVVGIGKPWPKGITEILMGYRCAYTAYLTFLTYVISLRTYIHPQIMSSMAYQKYCNLFLILVSDTKGLREIN